MSLRDQLLKAGVVGKKDIRKANQQAKKRRKQKQGSKERRHQVEAREKARAQAEREAQLEERRANREAADRARDAFEHALQIRNTLMGNQIKNRGDFPFHFKGPDGRKVLQIKVQRKVAEEIAKGAIAIAGLDLGNRVQPILIGAAGAQKLVELGAEGVILHWARQMPEDDGGGLLQRDWETSLKPHRVQAVSSS